MNPRTAVCTICSNNYLHFARTLMDSVRRVHPEWEQYVLLVDEVGGLYDPGAEKFRLVEAGELPLPERRKFLFRYSILELNTAVKPWLLQWLLAQGAERVVYLDPDIYLYEPLVELEQALGEGANIVLTPHLTGPLADRKKPSELDILRAGSWNLGFLGIRRSETVERFLGWWQEKMEFQCVVDFPAGLFVDQKWVDLVPGMYPGVFNLRHEGYNVAYWNLAHREVSKQNGQVVVNGAPLRFFHYSGLNPTRPEPFSKHQDRFRYSQLNPVLRELVDGYCQAVRASGLETCRKWPYAFGAFDDGAPIIDRLREYYRHHPEVQADGGEDPFRLGADYFNAPCDRPGDPLVSRVMHAIWESRPDLQRFFPDLSGASRFDYAYWFVHRVADEASVPDCYVEPVRASLARARSAQVHKVRSKAGVLAAARWLKPVGKRLPRPVKERIKRMLLNGHAVPPPPPPSNRRRQPSAGGYSGVYAMAPDDQRLGLAWMGSSTTVRTPTVEGGQTVRITGDYMAEAHRRAGAARTTLQVGLDGVSLGEIELTTTGNFDEVFTLPEGRYQNAELSIHASHCFVPAELGMNDDARQLSVRLGKIEIGETVLLDFAHPRPYLPHAEQLPLSVGVNIVGYLRSELGVGQSARLCAQAALAAEVPHALVDFSVGCSSRAEDHTLAGRIDNHNRHQVNLFHINADQLPLVHEHLGAGFFDKRYNIGYWHWELPVFPDDWLGSFNYLDEVWVPTQFVLQAVAEKSPLPVFCVPHAIDFDVSPDASRARFGLPADHFLFLVMYDMHSFQARKNPQAVVDAFARAFPKPRNVSLVVKTMNSRTYPEEFQALARRLQQIPGTLVIDQTLSRQEVYDLEAVCDTFVSLHRSEGFGLGLAESMFLGKPVIGTNWSGNVDFMNPKNSCPVDYKLIEVDRDYGPYKKGQLWADPDIDQAAWYMQKLVEDTSFRAGIAAAGQQSVRSQLSPAAIGRRYRRRLEVISRVLASG